MKKYNEIEILKIISDLIKETNQNKIKWKSLIGYLNWQKGQANYYAAYYDKNTIFILEKIRKGLIFKKNIYRLTFKINTNKIFITENIKLKELFDIIEMIYEKNIKEKISRIKKQLIKGVLN